MRQQLRTSTILLALLASSGFAVAQAPGGGRGEQGQLNLSPAQERSVGQGLATQPSQSGPSGYQGQIGGRVPEGLAPHPLPNQVTEQVPAAKNYLFVKLPDRVLLIDPATQVVAEIVMLPEMTGSGGGSDMPASEPGSPSSPSGGAGGPPSR